MCTPINIRHFLGLFLISLATLLLELSLTRVLSVSLWYHFGFLVISTALLGFGASGVTLALWTGLREKHNLDSALGILGLLFALSVVASFWLMQKIPFDPFSVAVEHWQLLLMPLYFVVAAIPFFWSGLAISLLLTRGSGDVNRLYAYDLVGAGIGCALVTFTIPKFGGSGAVLFSAFVGALAAICFSGWTRRTVSSASAIVAVLLLGASFRGDRLLSIHVSANKLPAGPSRVPVYSAWNTLSLVEVFEGHPPKGPALRRMIIDAGTAATGMQDLRPDVQTVMQQRPDDVVDDSRIVYVGKQSPRILIIGSGGGGQVLTGLKENAASITAVEINPTINDIVSHRMNDFWGNLFHQPSVNLVTDEGRSFVRRSREKYDAIISVHTISNAAVASGALSLAENYVLTREAFEDYLAHLTADGFIYFTRPEFQIPRLFATAREAFAQRGLGGIEGHLLAFAYPTTLMGGGLPNRQTFLAGFLLKKSALQPDEVKQMRMLLNIGSAQPDAPHILYAPDETHSGSIYDQIVRAADVNQVYRSTAVQLAPATDDKPFFNQHTRLSRIRWSTIVDLFSQKQAFAARMALEDRPVAEVTLIILFLQAVIIAALCILLPLSIFDRRGLATAGRWNWLGYFSALGLGFIMIEIALLQRFLLFLGQPIYTYAIVLAGLLIFTGAGSYVAGKWKDEPQRTLRRVLPIALLVILATAVITPLVFAAALGLPLPARIVIAVVLIAPLGFMLGMPFPLGLRLVMRESSAFGAWAWGVNGFFTVIGTVLALMLGMMAGFRMVLLLSCLCYAIAFVAITRIALMPTRVAATSGTTHTCALCRSDGRIAANHTPH
jgi:hypothetical protein